MPVSLKVVCFWLLWAVFMALCWWGAADMCDRMQLGTWCEPAALGAVMVVLLLVLLLLVEVPEHTGRAARRRRL